MTEVDVRAAGWTYGAEHEPGDWDTRLPLPEGCYRTPDHTVVNSNGVAAQPNVRVYPHGGEINTPPTEDPKGQAQLLRGVLVVQPLCRVNHRSNLHVHVRVPGLRGSLAHLKQVQQYIHRELPAVLSRLEPIPAGVTPAGRKRERRRRVSHQTFLTPTRLARQLEAGSPEEFYRLEVPTSSRGVPLWHAQPRLCVNLRQLLQTDTVEFRHFPGTLNPKELLLCVQWCRDFMLRALAGDPLEPLWLRYSSKTQQPNAPTFPQFPPFDEEREVRYQATAAKSGLKPEEIKTNVGLILNGKFNERYAPDAYHKALQRAGALPR